MKILFVLLFFNLQPMFAQDKIEREYKIKPAGVPAKALDFISESFSKLKVNWYMEQGTRGRTIEAKIRKDGRLYSAEFDTSGAIQDIELLIKFKDIPEAVQQIIERNLQGQFSHFKVQKVQKQWIARPAVLHSLIRGAKVGEKFQTSYELVVTGKKYRRSNNYELLFNEEGVLVRQQKIVESNQQHLLF